MRVEPNHCDRAGVSVELHDIQKNLKLSCRTPPKGDDRWTRYRVETLALIHAWREGYKVAMSFHEFIRPLRSGRSSVRFVATCGTKGVAFRFGSSTSAEGIFVVVTIEEGGVDELIEQIEKLPSTAGYKKAANQLLLGWPTQRMVARSEKGYTKMVPYMQLALSFSTRRPDQFGAPFDFEAEKAIIIDIYSILKYNILSVTR